jgi:hypothetical protein
MDEEICDIIQPEKQRLTQSYANNGLDFDTAFQAVGQSS